MDLFKKKWFKLSFPLLAVLGVLKNIYVVVLTIFVIWMIFFDTNSLLIHLELQKEINKLERQKDFLQEEIEKDKELLDKFSDKKELEKFARENYYLKKKNEEIFLIEYEDSTKVKD